MLSKWSLKIGVFTFLSQLVIGLVLANTLTHYFHYSETSYENMINLLSLTTKCISGVAFIGIILSLVAAYKKEWSWRLFSGFILNLLGFGSGAWLITISAAATSLVA